jgi:ABC-2 type transport system permease protein
MGADSATAGVRAAAGAVIRPSARSRAIGLGSVFGKSVRDSRRGVLAIGGLLSLVVIVSASQVAEQFGTAQDRQQIASISAALPPVFQGLLGEPIAIETLGGFLSWRVLNFLAVLLGIWSVVSLSRTLAGEARQGSLEVLAGTPLPRWRIALEKLLGHVAALTLALATLGLATWASTLAFATLPGDEVSLAAVLAHMAWVGLAALAGGTIAFALAPFLGRGSAAGIASVVLLASWALYGYRDLFAGLDALVSLSWFSWTAGHRPLAGAFDWPSVVALSGLVVVCSATGIGAFATRDIGSAVGLPLRMPRLFTGLGGPGRRSFAERLPNAVGWGLGLGVYGAAIASSAPSLADTLSRTPQLSQMVARFYPAIDFDTSEGVLQLAFFGFGLLLVGLAAAALVGGWAGDELEHRLDLVLSTPTSRVRWALASGAAVLVSVAVLGAVAGALVVLGAASIGDAAVQPFVGTLVVALYGAAFAGVGLAVGGLVRPGLAAVTVTALTIGTYLLDFLGAALQLPEAILDLALSRHMGQAMAGDYDPFGLAACVALALGGLLLSAVGYARRDIGR